jgi:hypothetical protein
VLRGFKVALSFPSDFLNEERIPPAIAGERRIEPNGSDRSPNGRYRRILAIGARVRLGLLFDPEQPFVVAVSAVPFCPKGAVR